MRNIVVVGADARAGRDGYAEMTRMRDHPTLPSSSINTSEMGKIREAGGSRLFALDDSVPARCSSRVYAR